MVLLPQFQFGQTGDVINRPAIDAVVLIGSPPGIQPRAETDIREAVRIGSDRQGKPFDVFGEPVQFRDGSCHACLLDKIHVIRDGQSGQDSNDRDREHEFDETKSVSMSETRSGPSGCTKWGHLQNECALVLHGDRLTAMRFEPIQ